MFRTVLKIKIIHKNKKFAATNKIIWHKDISHQLSAIKRKRLIQIKHLKNKNTISIKVTRQIDKICKVKMTNNQNSFMIVSTKMLNKEKIKDKH